MNKKKLAIVVVYAICYYWVVRGIHSLDITSIEIIILSMVSAGFLAVLFIAVWGIWDWVHDK